MCVGEEVFVVFAEDFIGGGEAVVFRHAAVDHDEVGVEVFEVDLEGDVVDEGAEEVAFFFDLCFGVFAEADIDHGSGDSGGVAFAIADDGAANAEPAPGVRSGLYASVDC